MIDGIYQAGGAGNPGIPSGVLIDGAIYALQGQPPVAVSHGWGNLSFLYQLHG
jgi:hypothetical protein